jgi:hypothetical protein
MSILNHIFGILCVAGFSAFAGYVAYSFSTADKTLPCWQRFFTATRNSATLFVNATVGAALTLGNGILDISDGLNMPEVRTAVETNLTPKVATGIIAGIVLLNVAARFRSLGK